MTVLEFDKFKKLITPWPIAYYGEIQDLSLEFDLPTCACFESVNNITLNFYKKDQVGVEDSLLVTSVDFTLFDQTTWTGQVSFTGEALLEYIQSVAEGTAVMDGEFIFQVAGNKTIKSQVFYVKIYNCKPPLPPEPEYPNKDEMDKAIADAIEKHNTDLNAHKDLLISRVNEIDVLNTTSLENHYVYDEINKKWIFDTTLNGNVIYINSVDSTIESLILDFTNNRIGDLIRTVIYKPLNCSISFIAKDGSTISLVEAEKPSDWYILEFVPIRDMDQIKVINK